MFNVTSITITYSEEFTTVDFLIDGNRRAKVIRYFHPGGGGDHLVRTPEGRWRSKLVSIADAVITAAVDAELDDPKLPADDLRGAA